MLSAKVKELYRKELFRGKGKKATLISSSDCTKHWIGRVNFIFVLEVKAQQLFQ